MKKIKNTIAIFLCLFALPLALADIGINEAPQGFAPGFDVLSGEDVLDIQVTSVDTNTFTAQITVDHESTPDAPSYIYRYGYVYKNGEWVMFEFDQAPYQGSNWISAFASTTLTESYANYGQNSNDDDFYVVIYSAKYYPSQGSWVAGCTDATLTDCNNWMIDSRELGIGLPPPPPGFCGNGVCDAGETHDNCAGDCPVSNNPFCGNGVCDAGETSDSCATDCPPSNNPVCGNGFCEAGESTDGCPVDCGGPVCGDNVCEDGEDQHSCSADCGEPDPIVCHSRSDCPAATVGSNTCSGDDLITYYDDYDCVNAGTTHSACIPVTTSTTTLCDNGCANEACVISAQDAIWVSPQRIAELPASGEAWDEVVEYADKNADNPDLTNQNDQENIIILAKALVYAKTGDTKYRDDVVDAITYIVNNPISDGSGRALAVGRESGTYPIAADLINLKSFDPALNEKFKAALIHIRDSQRSGGPDNIIECQEERPNNWGMHCGATRLAIARYLGDDAEVARVAQVFKGWLGDRSSYSGFSYGSLDWQADPNNPVGINPVGATINGHNVDGVLPDDQRRAGGFSWPPPQENYVYEGLQGTLATAVMLHNAGYDVWNWEDKALLRAFKWLDTQAEFPASGDDSWQPHLINYYYGEDFPATVPTTPGKFIGYTDWTHQQ